MLQMKPIARAIVALWFLIIPAYTADAPSLTLFSTEQQAQTHCPADTVVWLNTPSGIHHFRGQRWYAVALKKKSVQPLPDWLTRSIDTSSWPSGFQRSQASIGDVLDVSVKIDELIERLRTAQANIWTAPDDLERSDDAASFTRLEEKIEKTIARGRALLP